MTPTLALITRLRAYASRIDEAVSSADGRGNADLGYYLGGADPREFAADIRNAADRLLRSAKKGLDEFLAETEDP